MSISETDDARAEVDLFDIARAVWRGRWWMLASILLFSTLAVIYALRSPEWFQADVVMVQSDRPASSPQLGQLGGFAGLMGISLGSSGSQAPLALLRSRDFIRDYITDNGLVQVLFAGQWDEAAGKWKIANSADQPDVRDAVDFFDRNVRILAEDKKTGAITLSIRWTNAELAAKWANDLATRANARLQSRALAEANRNISFLRGELSSSQIPALQQSISRVLESEMQKLLMAKGADDFAFMIVDRAVAPKHRYTPNRRLIAMLGLMFGVVVGGGISLVLYAHGLRRPRRFVQVGSIEEGNRRP